MYIGFKTIHEGLQQDFIEEKVSLCFSKYCSRLILNLNDESRILEGPSPSQNKIILDSFLNPSLSLANTMQHIKHGTKGKCEHISTSSSTLEAKTNNPQLISNG